MINIESVANVSQRNHGSPRIVGKIGVSQSSVHDKSISECGNASLDTSTRSILSAPENSVIVKAAAGAKNVIDENAIRERKDFRKGDACRENARQRLVSVNRVADLSRVHLVKSRRNGYLACIRYKISVEARRSCTNASRYDSKN